MTIWNTYNYSRLSSACRVAALLLLPLAASLPVCGADSQYRNELKVDMNPPTARKDILTPHWENWGWRDGTSGSRKFGDVTVTFKAVGQATVGTEWYKGLLVYGARVAAEGITVKEPEGTGRIEMVISGLTPGKHTVVTYHNEVRKITPAKYDIFVDNVLRIKGLAPSKRAKDDYDVTSAFLEVDAEAGEDVVIGFRPDGSGTLRSCIINGFEIDTVDPHRKAVKPNPGHDDEHVPVDAALQWTAAEGAVSHHLYLGENSDAVAKATPSCPEFKGNLKVTRYPLPRLDHMKTYFWRVEEVHAAEATPVRGELWRFRIRFPAFPTAEGYGRFARGGRGGRVIEVTNVLDYDTTKGQAVIPGSYRAAVEAAGPRTIVFRVSGFIPLKRPCSIKNPYVTVAGQTAPGDGICLGHYRAGLYACHDAIVRFIRCRVGDHCRKAMDGS